MTTAHIFLACVILFAQPVNANTACKVHDIDFIMIEGDPALLALEDDIRSQLAIVGFNVSPRILSKEEFNAVHVSGDFHLSFSETWGAPYDPHSFADAWMVGDEGHYQALTNLEPPMTRDSFFQDIEQVLREESHEEREIMWKSIHNSLHQQAIMLPLWGKRIPTVLNRRLTGYEAGLQQFDYAVHRLQVLSGSTTVTIAPGAQTGMFQSVGRLDPHTYRPNEFFANNWVYEGLVSYGSQGQILPALASSWTIENTNEGGQIYTFTLRPGVLFHDGAPWDCSAAKLNFDHVMADPLLSGDYHGWYGVPKNIASWHCASDMELVVTTKTKYYAFLQELTFIRPMRMLSPTAFVGNADPITENSCHVGWGTITGENGIAVTCAGIANISGTGPFMFSSRTPSSQGADVDDKVTFVRNERHWEGTPSVEELVVVRYDSSAEIKAALQNGSLDVMWGAGVLSSPDVSDLVEESDLLVYHSDDIQNSLLLLNSGKPPLDDITIRKTIIHAIDKVTILQKEFGELERPVDNVFPLDAPYSDVVLTPRWDYDIEKALLLNCQDPSSDKALALGLGLGGVCIVLFVASMWFIYRYRKAEHELSELRNEQVEKAVSA